MTFSCFILGSSEYFQLSDWYFGFDSQDYPSEPQPRQLHLWYQAIEYCHVFSDQIYQFHMSQLVSAHSRGFRSSQLSGCCSYNLEYQLIFYFERRLNPISAPNLLSQDLLAGFSLYFSPAKLEPPAYFICFDPISYRCSYSHLS